MRKMKTKWGSCNPEKAQVWLNLELAKKQPPALDYVILHEIAHFTSDRHDDRFVEVLDTMMPTWREVRREMNDMPLAHELSFD
ncbi:M48 family metallopeptidase [Roseobacter litoralis]|uniref:M48 family metallopeptidase n=1 Tax=Roseobacter litoralis TaxID=42443 RepID=UPI0024947824|nr:M48 family metallopeptidase [Roseobacter litoralis]